MASFFNNDIGQEPDMLHRVLRLLYDSRMSSFTKADLEYTGVTVGPFELGNPLFMNDSSKCLFQPYNEHTINNWEIPAYLANSEGIKARLDLQDVDLSPQFAPSPNPNSRPNPFNPNPNSNSGEIYLGIKEVIAYLNTNFTFRFNEAGARLSAEVGWSVMDPRQVHSRNKFFLFAGHGSQLGIPFPSWQVWSMQVWREKNLAGRNYQTGPSLRLIISSEAVASPGRLQLNELGAIAECLAFRRTQKEYPYYPIIPILVLSLFGRRHGRIIQATYEVSTGKIDLLISPTLSFLNKTDPAFDIFLRFMASYPPESSSRDQALARMSISFPPPGLGFS